MTNVQKKEVSGETSKPIITEKVPTVKRTKTVVIERVNKNTGKVTKFTYAKVAARLAEFHLANDKQKLQF
jgi:hypothetical protein